MRDNEGKQIERRLLREVNWIFIEEKGWSIDVGGYVGRPIKAGGDELLEAEFAEELEIEVSDQAK